MAKRGNGEGSIYQRSDGKWCGAISIGWTDDGKLKRRTIYGKTRKEVADKIAVLKNDHILGRPIEPTKISVAEHFNNWLQQKKLHNRPGTWARDESHIRNHIIPYLGRIKLATLSHSDITAFYLYLQEETELSQRTIYDIATILRAGLKDAVNKKLIYQSPAELVPKPKKGDKEARFLDQEEVNRFLYAATGERLEDLFILMLNTGLRPGEALGLVWDRVDFYANRITIVDALHEVNGKLFMGDVKTTSGRRTISLTETAVQCLKRQRKRQLEYQLAAGEEWGNELNLVFTSEKGSPLRRTSVNKHDLRRITKKANIEGVSLHTFRHTHASLLIYAGVDIKTISSRLGHADITTTLQVYGHVLPGQDEKAAQAMEALMNSIIK